LGNSFSVVEPDTIFSHVHSGAILEAPTQARCLPKSFFSLQVSVGLLKKDKSGQSSTAHYSDLVMYIYFEVLLRLQL